MEENLIVLLQNLRIFFCLHGDSNKNLFHFILVFTIYPPLTNAGQRVIKGGHRKTEVPQLLQQNAAESVNDVITDAFGRTPHIK